MRRDYVLGLAAFHRLRAADQEVLGLVVWEGMSSAQAAALMQCSLSTLYVRLYRARQSLQREYLRLAEAHRDYASMT
jgi:DNA-directed RNA polymerase specialized sigma24 family protein